MPFRCLWCSLALKIFFCFMFVKFAYVYPKVRASACNSLSLCVPYRFTSCCVDFAPAYVFACTQDNRYICLYARAKMFLASAYVCACARGNRYICMRAQMFGICCPLWILLSKTRKSFDSVVCFGFCCQKRLMVF